MTSIEDYKLNQWEGNFEFAVHNNGDAFSITIKSKQLFTSTLYSQ